MGFYLFREQTRALKLKQRENALFISQITTAFAKVIVIKDSYTNDHSSRADRYTAMLARELGCDEETVEKGESRDPDDHGDDTTETIDNIRK